MRAGPSDENREARQGVAKDPRTGDNTGDNTDKDTDIDQGRGTRAETGSDRPSGQFSWKCSG